MRLNSVIYSLLFTITLLSPGCNTDQHTAVDSIPENFLEATGSLEILGEGFLSTHLDERDLAISKDGNEIYFTRNSLDNQLRTIMMMKKVNGKWQNAEVASFSGMHKDIEPFLSPDNQKIFFASDRPLSDEDIAGDYNIWFVSKNDNGWSAPVHAGPSINTDGNEYYPSVSSNGNLYFTAEYADGAGLEDIYVSEFVNGQFAKPVMLDTAINTPTYEFNAYISPNEEIIFFTSYGRPDGIGGGDLYMSQKKNGKWRPAIHLENGINSISLDYCPLFDPVTSSFYFTSNRSKEIEVKQRTLEEIKAISNSIYNGKGNIYKIKLDI